MSYTSGYAQNMMKGGDEPRKKKAKVTSGSGTIKGEKFTRQDAKSFKKESGSDARVGQIKRRGTKYKF